MLPSSCITKRLRAGFQARRGTGNNVLDGSLADDTLDGGEGVDRLFAGAGTDRLMGSAGADIFTLQRDSGLDVVSDFRNGQDRG